MVVSQPSDTSYWNTECSHMVCHNHLIQAIVSHRVSVRCVTTICDTIAIVTHGCEWGVSPCVSIACIRWLWHTSLTLCFKASDGCDTSHSLCVSIACKMVCHNSVFHLIQPHYWNTVSEVCHNHLIQLLKHRVSEVCHNHLIQAIKTQSEWSVSQPSDTTIETQSEWGCHNHLIQLVTHSCEWGVSQPSDTNYWNTEWVSKVCHNHLIQAIETQSEWVRCVTTIWYKLLTHTVSEVCHNHLIQAIKTQSE